MSKLAFCPSVPAGFMGVLLAIPAAAQSPGARPDYWHGGWGHMMFGSFMMLFVLGAVVLAVVLAVRFLGGTGQRFDPPAPERKALAILEERFARGEIDKEEFEERKQLLQR